MASDAQVASFASAWAPYAARVGAQRGVSPATVLTQWGMESDYGTNAGSRYFNVAGITQAGVPGQWAQYSSPDDFASAFSDLLARNYPSAVGTQENVSAYVSGLAQGRTGSYFGSQSPDSYAAALQGASNRLANVAPDTYASLAGSAGGPSNLSWWQRTPGAVAGALGGVVGDALKPLAANIALVALGAALVVVIVAAGAMGRPPAAVIRKAVAS